MENERREAYGRPEQVTRVAEDREARFEFGENWSRFLKLVDEPRIQAAEESLKRMLGVSDLEGKTFLDIGSGSGLSSLAARRLGARVHSFDYDPASVGCTAELKRRYYPGDSLWIVEQASALDGAYLAGLGLFDVVYSWGVLHHTGDMWTALANAALLVRPEGLLFVALYNDQGKTSARWRKVKKIYVSLPAKLRFLVVWPAFLVLWGKPLLRDLLLLHLFRSWRAYGARGMSPWRDLIDWVGGYPFEVAKPEAVFRFYRDRGFRLLEMTTDRGLGCNEFVFRKDGE